MRWPFRRIRNVYLQNNVLGDYCKSCPWISQLNTSDISPNISEIERLGRPQDEKQTIILFTKDTNPAKYNVTNDTI